MTWFTNNWAERKAAAYNTSKRLWDVWDWSVNVWFYLDPGSRHDKLNWGWWELTLSDWTIYNINSWTTWNIDNTTYLYFDKNNSPTEILFTDSSSWAVGWWKVLVWVINPWIIWESAQFQIFWWSWVWVFIWAESIATNELLANKILANNANIWWNIEVGWAIYWWKTSYSSDVPWFWLWNDWWTSKFKIWNDESSLDWDWSTLNITGNITLSNSIPNTKVTWLGPFATSNTVPYWSVDWPKPPTDADVTLSAIEWELSLNWWWLVLASSWAKIRWGQTAYDTWNWFWLWDVGWTTKFSLWNSAWDKLLWTWSKLEITGDITMTWWSIWWTYITWAPDIPTLPDYIESTKITSTTIESPTITAWEITWSTVTWWTIQTSENWQRIEITSNNRLNFYKSDWKDWEFIWYLQWTTVNTVLWTVDIVRTIWTNLWTDWALISNNWVITTGASAMWTILPTASTNRLWSASSRWERVYTWWEWVNINWYFLYESWWNLYWDWVKIN